MIFSHKHCQTIWMDDEKKLQLKRRGFSLICVNRPFKKKNLPFTCIHSGTDWFQTEMIWCSSWQKTPETRARGWGGAKQNLKSSVFAVMHYLVWHVPSRYTRKKSVFMKTNAEALDCADCVQSRHYREQCRKQNNVNVRGQHQGSWLQCNLNNLTSLVPNHTYTSHIHYTDRVTYPTVMSKMLEPTELDTAMSPSPFRATITLVMRSGMEVPAANMVRPIISSVIPMVSPTCSEGENETKPLIN